MHKHPTDGISGAKPRVPGAGGNGKVSKEELGALNREYLAARNRSQLAKAADAEMSLQERQGTLVSRRMVALEASFLLTAFRQSLLGSPVTIARELVVAGAIEPGQAHALERALDGRFRKLLNELASLPARLADPNWCNQIEGDLLEQVNGAESQEPRTPTEAKAQAAKAKVRAARKLGTQRARREGRANLRVAGV
jgi:hypothetical protein